MATRRSILNRLGISGFLAISGRALAADKPAMVPANLRYTATHEWIQAAGPLLKAGLTDHAQREMSDFVFVELPKVGTKVKAGDRVAVVESVKAASDVYAPISGVITAVNTKLADNPELVNTSPYKNGWMFEIKPSNSAELEELMTDKAYKEHIK